MPQNNARYTAVWTFACQDGTPLYLTVDGQSGSAPLDLASWWRFCTYSTPALELSTTTGELQVLDAPNDYQLYVEVPSVDMESLQPGTYMTDIIATLDGEQIGYGSLEIPVTQGLTDIP